MFHMLGPTIVARKIAKVSAGSASQVSVDAHDDLVDPAAEIARQDAERGADDAGERCTAVKPTTIDTRAPKISRDSTSRPSWSVPSR